MIYYYHHTIYLMQHTDKTLWQVVKGYFNALPYKNEGETIQEISSGVTFHGANLWILVFDLYRFVRFERQFYGRYYRCHAYLSLDGPDCRNGTRRRYQ